MSARIITLQCHIIIIIIVLRHYPFVNVCKGILMLQGNSKYFLKNDAGPSLKYNK